MRRFKIGLGVAAVLFILLAWAWPDGSDREEGDGASVEAHASAPPPEPETRPTTDEADAEPTTPGEDEAPADAAPSTVEATAAEQSVEPSPTAEPSSAAYAGPFGTRNHTGSNAVALTFDDGPDPNWTPKVLDALRERGVKATFCVIGSYAEANPDLIADIVHDGHTLCNHSWNHELDLGEWSDGEIKANLRRTNDAIRKAAPGAEVAYFRQPGGRWTDRAIGVAAELGMESLHWAVDPSDWDRSTSDAQIRDHVIARSEPGAIVLLHDGASNQRSMLSALDPILDEFERRGYAVSSL